MPDRPNILLIQTDEHAPMYSSTYGHPLVQTPHMDRLAAEGVTFQNAYCNSPLCGPSRMSFMTGRYLHNIGCYDNASPLASDTLTWAHMLRAAGYDAVLCGKQHFCGTDQLHGFRAQLARDLHAELWTEDGVPRGTPDWSKGVGESAQPWAGLQQAGPGTTEEIRVDDEVEQQALDYIRDPARRQQPWILNVSFIAPHFPLVAPQRYFEPYPLESIDLPVIPPGHLAKQHPVYQRMRQAFGLADFSEDLVRRGRAGYYALISYMDEKIGRLLDALEATDQRRNTLVAHFSDHGEMNGEHGMWRKSNFYEASSRIPLQLSWPGHLPTQRRVEENVSLVDLVATLVDASGAPTPAPLDGDSLLPLCRDQDPTWKDEVFCEYLAHGIARPMAMLKRGHYKLNYSLGDPVELFDTANDPNEFTNLSTDSAHHSVQEELQQRLFSFWQPEEIEQQVLQSQQERLLIERACHQPS